LSTSPADLKATPGFTPLYSLSFSSAPGGFAPPLDANEAMSRYAAHWVQLDRPCGLIGPWHRPH
jgi:hypothetical protein